MAKPSDPVLRRECVEPTLVGRLARLACWQSGELQGLAEGRHQGPRQNLQDWQIIAGLVAQCLHASGCLQHIIWRYFAVQLSSSALSQRRQHMQFESFVTVMRHAMRPMASPQSHADCFFAGQRLVGIDGTQFNLLNTPQINAAVTKASTRRGEAAFGKLSLSGRVLRSSDGKWVEVRLWTSQSPQQASAEPLCAALGARALLQGTQTTDQPGRPAGRGTSGHCRELRGCGCEACGSHAHQLQPVPGIHRGVVHGVAGFAGTHRRTRAGITGQAGAGANRRRSPAATTISILPAQSPPTHRQMAAHARANFTPQPQTLCRLADCLAALPLKWPRSGQARFYRFFNPS